jgi:drug/metabolite transporter (DMT)-like permease
MLLAFVVLLPAAAIIHGVKTKKGIDTHKFMPKRLILCAMISGVFLFIASAFQQVGMQYTSVGHAGFLTALYLLMIPLLGLFVGRRVSLKLWVSIALALGGLWLLCMTSEGFAMNKGDLLMLGAAFFFSFQIMSLDMLAKDFDGVQYSAIQMLTAGLISLVCTFIFEEPTISGIWAARGSIAYAGIMSCGVAYTFQVIGQKDTHPTVASILMSLECVFAVLGGALLLSQIPTMSEIFGCILMLAATILSQIDVKKKAK